MKKILVVNPFGIGDAIFSLYAVRAMKAADPGLRVDFLVNERTSSLARLNADLVRVYEFGRDELRALRSKNPAAFLVRYASLCSEWRAERYDAMLDASLGREFAFLGFAAGIRERIGFDFKKRGFFLNRRTRFEGYESRPVADAQIRLLDSAGIRTLPVPARLPWQIPAVSVRRADLLLKDARVSGWAALAPGGGESWGADARYKQWDPERFAEAANAWAGPRGAGMMLFGGGSEKALLEKVRSLVRVPCAVICGEEFGTVAAALMRANFLLCNDGGLLHFAHSLGVKTVSLFGPVDAAVYGPYGTGVPHEVLTADVPCRPCYSRFRFPPCAHERRCLTGISVQNVLESIGKIT